MSDVTDHHAIVLENASMTLPVPAPREQTIHIRPATPGGADYDFIDALQKKHSKMVGFLHRKSIETYIENGCVLIAESAPRHSCEGRNPQTTDIASSAVDARFLGHDGDLARLGYCISKDTYHKREDVGVVYQMNIVPEVQRGLIAATLLREVFERSPYGVKLYCCWCAQDLPANHFWEAMGFTPLAFRTGSATRGKRGSERMHIFWQKRIRSGDTSTPWWFPSETKGGAIGEGRIVLPIPPGTHWSEAKPAVLPELPVNPEAERLALEDENMKKQQRKEAREARKRKKEAAAEAARSRDIAMGGLRAPLTPEELEARKKRAGKQKQTPQKRQRRKNDPKFVAAARELRDRFLEEVERQPELLEGQSTGGKYDVSRQIEAAPSAMKEPLPMLDAA